ncbi:MAG: Lrp/AsnC family transcriptional regulator [Deltaproteobacteria bacterium]|nr:Lrp/AsnC family transcriptional regulator [Deltaproteobacteria bacterium]
MPTKLEKKIIAAIQGDMPVTKRPYLEIAKRLDLTEETVLEVLRDLNNRGVIRRFGVTLKHQNSGFRANAMVAWRVDEARVEAVGGIMAAHQAVSHCYRRDPMEQWPYNLYTMIHSTDEAGCKKIAESLSTQTGVDDYAVLFSRKELKKTSMQYFEDEID